MRRAAVIALALAMAVGAASGQGQGQFQNQNQSQRSSEKKVSASAPATGQDPKKSAAKLQPASAATAPATSAAAETTQVSSVTNKAASSSMVAETATAAWAAASAAQAATDRLRGQAQLNTALLITLLVLVLAALTALVLLLIRVAHLRDLVPKQLMSSREFQDHSQNRHGASASTGRSDRPAGRAQNRQHADMPDELPAHQPSMRSSQQAHSAHPAHSELGGTKGIRDDRSIARQSAIPPPPDAATGSPYANDARQGPPTAGHQLVLGAAAQAPLQRDPYAAPGEIGRPQVTREDARVLSPKDLQTESRTSFDIPKHPRQDAARPAGHQDEARRGMPQSAPPAVAAPPDPHEGILPDDVWGVVLPIAANLTETVSSIDSADLTQQLLVQSEQLSRAVFQCLKRRGFTRISGRAVPGGRETNRNPEMFAVELSDSILLFPSPRSKYKQAFDLYFEGANNDNWRQFTAPAIVQKTGDNQLEVVRRGSMGRQA